MGLLGTFTLAAMAQQRTTNTPTKVPGGATFSTAASPAPKMAGDEGGIAGAANDACAGATALVLGVPVVDTTVGMTIDVVPACAPFSPASPGVWFTVVGNGSTLTASTCSPITTYDSAITIFCGACPALVCVGGNDDFCGLQTSVSWCSFPGEVYHILVFGFSTNGGCNSTPTVFGTVACGQTICGDAGTYLFAGGQRRDTDWYQITTSQPATFTWTVNAEFPSAAACVSPCPPVVLGNFATANPCNNAVAISGVQPAGTYNFFVAPSVFAGVACGSQYTATLTVDNPAACGPPCVLPGDTDGDGDVDADDLVIVILDWGNTCP